MLCLPLYGHAEVADKLRTVEGLWIAASATGCILGAAAFGIAYLSRWPLLAAVLPGLALLAALGPAIEPDIAVFAERELGADYLVQAEAAEWLLPAVAAVGVLGGGLARRRRGT